MLDVDVEAGNEIDVRNLRTIGTQLQRAGLATTGSGGAGADRPIVYVMAAPEPEHASPNGARPAAACSCCSPATGHRAPPRPGS